MLNTLVPYPTAVSRVQVKPAGAEPPDPLAEINDVLFGEAGVLKIHVCNEQALREMSRGLSEIAPAAARLKAPSGHGRMIASPGKRSAQCLS